MVSTPTGDSRQVGSRAGGRAPDTSRDDGVRLTALPDAEEGMRVAATIAILVAVPPWHPTRWHIHRGWLREALCIHRYEARDWHERSNPSSRGGMQFLYSTWRSAGGVGDPANASPREQLWRARIVWRRDGRSWREWPNTARLCGLW